MEIVLQPGQWVDINITEIRNLEFQKIAFGQQCFLLPDDVEVCGFVECSPGSTIRAFNASYETMVICF